MNGVDFIERNEFHIKSRRLLGEPATPTMISILLKTGIAKNEKQALLILLATILAAIGLTVALILMRTRPIDNVITDKYGETYELEEYVELVRQGNDPLMQ